MDEEGERVEEAEEGGDILISADGAATARGSVVPAAAAAVVVEANVALTGTEVGTRGQSYCKRTNLESITSRASFNS